jgi:hypothetical protein
VITHQHRRTETACHDCFTSRRRKVQRTNKSNKEWGLNQEWGLNTELGLYTYTRRNNRREITAAAPKRAMSTL